MLNIFSNKKTSKGFTLIELLVVVAIISLLSSVVLASLKEARDKAKATAFRQEVNEFIKAVELYRLDNNKYPTGFTDDTGTFRYYLQLSNGNIIVKSNNGTISIFESKIFKYLDKTPMYPFNTSNTSVLFLYTLNQATYNLKGCHNQADTNGYVLNVYINDNPAIAEAFSDWPYARMFVGVPSSTTKCFTL